MARQRRFLTAMAVLALACAVLQAVTGDAQLVLHLTPLFLIGGLLLAGRYVGEDRIVAAGAPRWPSRAGARARPLAAARRARPRLAARAHPSLLRGPPAALAAV